MSDGHSNGAVRFRIAFAWAEVSYVDLWLLTRFALRIPQHPLEARYGATAFTILERSTSTSQLHKLQFTSFFDHGLFLSHVLRT